MRPVSPFSRQCLGPFPVPPTEAPACLTHAPRVEEGGQSEEGLPALCGEHQEPLTSGPCSPPLLGVRPALLAWRGTLDKFLQSEKSVLKLLQSVITCNCPDYGLGDFDFFSSKDMIST